MDSPVSWWNSSGDMTNAHMKSLDFDASARIAGDKMPCILPNSV